MTKKVTKAQAQKVFAAVKKQRSAAVKAGGDAPVLDMEFDWLGFGVAPHVVWEGGPYEWTYLFPYGGVDEEFGYSVPDVSDMIPEGIYTEPMTSWALGVYREDT